VYDHARLFARVSAALANDLALTLEDLALNLHIHPHTLAQVIREHTGIRFSLWRARHRLVVACSLLEGRPDLSIKEIAAATGFSSTSVFDRFLRRACGRSPSQYRLVPASAFVELPPVAQEGACAPDPSLAPARPSGSSINILDVPSTHDRVPPDRHSATLDSCSTASSDIALRLPGAASARCGNHGPTMSQL
jgi:AraC-like DNA-binding protein